MTIANKNIDNLSKNDKYTCVYPNFLFSLKNMYMYKKCTKFYKCRHTSMFSEFVINVYQYIAVLELSLQMLGSYIYYDVA